MGDLRGEAEKHRVGERGRGKVMDVGGAVRDGVEGLRGGNGKGKGKGRSKRG
jgi:hypothetical protein